MEHRVDRFQCHYIYLKEEDQSGRLQDFLRSEISHPEPGLRPADIEQECTGSKAEARKGALNLRTSSRDRSFSSKDAAYGNAIGNYLSDRFLSLIQAASLKSRIAEDYNATAGIYDMRYREEQELKIGFILNRVRVRDGDTVIDAGCGTGLLLEAVSERAKAWLVGLDSSIGMLREAKSKGVEADLVLGDVESLPFRDCVADAVFSVSVIQLADDPGQAVSEIRRVTKAGGAIAISYLKRAGIRAPELAWIKAALHTSESMKDTFITGFRED